MALRRALLIVLAIIATAIRCGNRYDRGCGPDARGAHVRDLLPADHASIGGCGGIAVVIAGAVAATAASAPYFGLYRNAAARNTVGDALLFPLCELYDAGMREAARLVAQRARR